MESKYHMIEPVKRNNTMVNMLGYEASDISEYWELLASGQFYKYDIYNIYIRT